MASFFLVHYDTLERVCLKNCFAWTKQDWLNIFNIFLNSRLPTRLVEFNIVSYPVRLRHGQSDYFEKGDIYGHDMSEEAKKEKMRKFVVGDANLTFKQFQPVEMYADDNDPELDESDVIERWKELDRLMERNRKRLSGR
ncbi:unnamed protein product [Fusarium venenatum]|uniref:Uncharacterized protein n=1 Tax=Fusarium venenatum TaxID=56646 RepID=A0A2L2TNN5_9HYPO|nr:uncharacterized protein FVRRES_03863 [Fusarium venenatum]CEI67351.1 unnamed protein product [Fusarium venenatum]